MTIQQTNFDRRTAIRTAGIAVIAGVAGCLGDGGSNGEDFVDDEPDYGNWFDDVDNYEGTMDLRGEEEVIIRVGTGEQGVQFDPPAIMVDHLTTVVWEWTGEGGQHDVTHEPDSDDEDPVFESELMGEEGETYEHTFNHEQVYKYYCSPHVDLGMKGAVTVEH